MDGRAAELAVVRRHFDTGSGLLLITGEAGIGKTTTPARTSAATATLNTSAGA
jgi:Tfp pilus assembly pilus retraction ATPase PilT